MRDEARVPERKTTSGFVSLWKWFGKQLTRHEVVTLTILSVKKCAQRGSGHAALEWVSRTHPGLCTSSYAWWRSSLSQPGGGAREPGWVSSSVFYLCPCFSLLLASLGWCLLQVPLSPCPVPGDTKSGVDPRNGRLTVRPNDTDCVLRGQGRPSHISTQASKFGE